MANTKSLKVHLNVPIKLSLHRFVKGCVFRYNNWVRSEGLPRLTEAQVVEIAITVLKEMGVDFREPKSLPRIKREAVVAAQSMRRKRIKRNG